MLSGQSIKSKSGSTAEKNIRKAGRKQDAYASGGINQIKTRFHSRKKHTQGRQEARCVCFRVNQSNQNQVLQPKKAYARQAGSRMRMLPGEINQIKILTAETKSTPLNVRLIRDLIACYCL